MAETTTRDSSIGGSYRRAKIAGTSADMAKTAYRADIGKNIFDPIQQTASGIVSMYMKKQADAAGIKQPEQPGQPGQPGQPPQPGQPVDPTATDQTELNKFAGYRDDAYDSLTQNVLDNQGALDINYFTSSQDVLNAIGNDLFKEEITDVEAEAIKNNLEGINAREKEVRLNFASVNKNGWSNFDSDYSKNIAIEYLDNTTKRRLSRLKGPDGKFTDPATYEYEFFSPSQNRYISTTEMEKLLNENRKDVGMQKNMRKLFYETSDYLSTAEQVDPNRMNNVINSINTMVDEGDPSKMANDDILEGRVFADDLENHPVFEMFRKPKRQQDITSIDAFGKPYPEGMGLDLENLDIPKGVGEKNWWDNISEKDIKLIKGAVLDKNNPHYNPEVTKELLKEYYTEAINQLKPGSVTDPGQDDRTIQWNPDTKRYEPVQFKSELGQVNIGDTTGSRILNPMTPTGQIVGGGLDEL
jgi:hypothetical protein